MAGDETVTENCMLAYFVEKSKTLKSPASLWTEYSMLKSTQCRYFQISEAKSIFKRKNEAIRRKKSKVLTREEVEAFWKEADDRSFLLIKVVMIVGIAGTCRSQELCDLSLGNVQDMGNEARCMDQPVGKNRFSAISTKIAQFLNLPYAEGYTGHSFRKTSATLLANTGATVLALKRFGGWK
ncbi:hypothetical protein NQ315_016690 [Exocentrus adspersus]|uniref:Tyr recombinase domain-containing protein n=1 Tax=Exocentrus adspersus TaxID=1586481 RepID=A0AAV8VF20_9CUCU|nr:hypothetical protein NQ315_016690 [Exocentrus adspersus]